MSRIASLFARLREEQRLGFFGYLTVGYPEIDSTVGIAEAILQAGTDLIELGMPFSDPLAEGRTIQATSQRALRNGVNIATCLETAWALRQRTEAPLVLMGYLNPLLSYGLDRFAQHAANAGVDGVILPDLSLEEGHEIQAVFARSGLDMVLFAAPTSTDDRLDTVARLASGFIYCIAVTGVTGGREELGADVDGLLARMQARTTTPLGLGFGLSRPEHLQRLAGKVDAAIVGSALLDAARGPDPARGAAEFVRWMLGKGPAPGVPAPAAGPVHT